MAKKLLWATETRKVSDLKDHPNNPRTLSKKSHADLLASFDEFDYVELVAVDADNTIIAGHQRIHIMLELGWGDKEIEVRAPNRKLTQKEQRKYLILSNKLKGDWDYDILADQWEIEELFDAGFTEQDLLGHFPEEEGEEEEVDEKSYDESLTDNLDLIVKFVIVIPNEDSTSLQNQLDSVLKGFPRAKMEKKV